MRPRCVADRGPVYPLRRGAPSRHARSRGRVRGACAPRSRPEGRSCRDAGLTLVEVLVAAALAAGLAVVAYGWLWGLSGACTRETRAGEAQTRLAAVHRRLALDLAQTLTLVRPADGLDGRRFALRTIDADGVVRDVEYCWDPLRGVLWRSASSSYVADGVRAFSVAYLDAAGAPVAPSALRVDADGRVEGAAALAVSASAAAGRGSVEASWVFAVPTARL